MLGVPIGVTVTSRNLKENVVEVSTRDKTYLEKGYILIKKMNRETNYFRECFLDKKRIERLKFLYLFKRYHMSEKEYIDFANQSASATHYITHNN